MAPPSLLTAFLAGLPAGVEAVAARRGNRWIVGVEPDIVLRASGAAAFDSLDTLSPGFWAGWLAYDLGRAVERVAPRASDDLGLDDVVLGRFDARAVVDEEAGTVEVVGDGRGRRLLEAARDLVGDQVEPAPPRLTRWESGIERGEYEAAVRAIVELIRAGDCYQVNLTRRLVADETADARAMFAALRRHNPAPHAALAGLAGTTVVSASPERFLALRDGVVETRPVKGTGRHAASLAASEKDRAENVMIVDLARNDLGRVCEFGTIEVPGLCEVEAHPGLHHLVSTVRGRLRPDVGVGGLLAATFPPASITGAPKPRVMQIIEDLEPVRRGVYCGAVGWIDTRGERPAADLNVAIRTFTITGGRTLFGVGGGVVADSDPRGEWDETELKAHRLLAACGAASSAPAVSGVRG